MGVSLWKGDDQNRLGKVQSLESGTGQLNGRCLGTGSVVWNSRCSRACLGNSGE